MPNPSDLDSDLALGNPLLPEDFRPTALRFLGRVADEARTPEMWPVMRMLFAPGWPPITDTHKPRCPFCRSQNYLENPDLGRYGRYCLSCKNEFVVGKNKTPEVPDSDNRYGEA